MDIILASSSPRRKELIKQLFQQVEIAPQSVDEVTNLKKPSYVVRYLSKIKLARLPKDYPDKLIISADTIVFRRGKIYGKPKDKEQAVEFLMELEGKWHVVYTGVCIAYQGKTLSFCEKTRVKFKKMTVAEINKYIDDKNPLDKAGAYGAQDNEVVDKFEGSFSNIVGLPLERLTIVLKGIINI